MAGPAQLLVCSDIHYASAGEKARLQYEVQAIDSPTQRLLLRFYRRFIWLRDPFAHNHLLDRVLAHSGGVDLAVANGDYSCDSAFVGVMDEAARQSAGQCLGKLRDRFGERFAATFGDHELGKLSAFAGRGGLRLESWRVARAELGLEPVWTRRFGRYVLAGMTSTLAAMEVYAEEALPEERNEWLELQREHLAAVRSVFASLRPDDRLLLFCHDPTALPFLWEMDEVRRRAGQIERTIIGHLHSELILRQSRLLSGMPRLNFGGPTVRRLSAALARGRVWRHFNLLLCPSLAGIELTKKGGYYTAQLDPDARQPARFELHRIPRR